MRYAQFLANFVLRMRKKTAISELHIKILTTPLDSVTPIFLKRAIGDQTTF